MNNDNKDTPGVPLKTTKNESGSPAKEIPKMRQIIIETNGNDINLKMAEVSGKIELLGILQTLINYINQQK